MDTLILHKKKNVYGDAEILLFFSTSALKSGLPQAKIVTMKILSTGKQKNLNLELAFL
jgi:hypothetical protein